MKKNNEEPSPVGGEIANLIATSKSLLKDIADLAKLEAQLAQQSIFVLIGIALFVFILILSVWLCLQGVIFFLLVLLGMKNIYAFLCLMLFNLGLVVPMYFLAKKYMGNLGFKLTRAQLLNGLQMEDKQ